MAFEGAIFDMDGTLVDSMPMWNRVFVGWLEDHGVPDAAALSDKYEYMNFGDEVYFFHDNYGVGATREEAMAEVLGRVRHEYETTVRPFDGCKAFLQELADAGIPMAVASSTTLPEVKFALACHGLDQYFSHLFYTGDVGRSKEHPDVYLAALKAIGTPMESTWVFEDAPFGCKTAHDAGFHVACLFNDHDGRDEQFMRENSTLLVHGYSELSFALLNAWKDEA